MMYTWLKYRFDTILSTENDYPGSLFVLNEDDIYKRIPVTFITPAGNLARLASIGIDYRGKFFYHYDVEKISKWQKFIRPSQDHYILIPRSDE